MYYGTFGEEPLPLLKVLRGAIQIIWRNFIKWQNMLVQLCTDTNTRHNIDMNTQYNIHRTIDTLHGIYICTNTWHNIDTNTRHNTLTLTRNSRVQNSVATVDFISLGTFHWVEGKFMVWAWKVYAIGVHWNGQKEQSKKNKAYASVNTPKFEVVKWAFAGACNMQLYHATYTYIIEGMGFAATCNITYVVLTSVW